LGTVLFAALGIPAAAVVGADRTRRETTRERSGME
jgi:hypothetical protein